MPSYSKKKKATKKKLAVISKTKLSTKRGRAYTICANSSRRINIKCDEVQYISEVKDELSNRIVENERLRTETNSVAKRCDELANNLAYLTEEKNGAEEKLEEQIRANAELHKNQERLLQYVDKIQQWHGMSNKGKKLSEVGGRHQNRKLKELKSKIEQSVWFAKTFDISLCSVEVKDDAGVYHTMSFTSEKQKTCRSYKNLSEED